MATQHGFWLPIFGNSQASPGSFSSWDSTHQSRYTETGANRLIRLPIQSSSPSLEDDVLDWIVAGTGRPTLCVVNRKDNAGRRLPNLAHSDSGLSQSAIQTGVQEILTSYDNAGYTDGIWGYEVLHEDYDPGATSPYWEELGWVVDEIATQKPGKAIVWIGSLFKVQNESVDTVLQKVWSSADGLIVVETGYKEAEGDVEEYVWRSGKSVEWSVQHQEAAWREGADKAQAIASGNPNHSMSIVSCHHQLYNGSDLFLYPDEQELLYTALGSISHGGQGTLFFLFEEGWGQNAQGDTRDYFGVYGNATQHGHVTNAITRMEEVSGYLQFFTFDAYAHSDTLPGSWNLDSVSSGDPWNMLNVLEVCHWFGPDGEEAYAMCNRDPDATKSVSMSFNATYNIYHDGVFQGAMSSYAYTASRGDVDVIRAE